MKEGQQRMNDVKQCSEKERNVCLASVKMWSQFHFLSLFFHFSFLANDEQSQISLAQLDGWRKCMNEWLGGDDGKDDDEEEQEEKWKW